MTTTLIIDGTPIAASDVPSVSERLAARYGITVADLRELSWTAVVALESAYKRGQLAGAGPVGPQDRAPRGAVGVNGPDAPRSPGKRTLLSRGKKVEIRESFPDGSRGEWIGGYEFISFYGNRHALVRPIGSSPDDEYPIDIDMVRVRPSRNGAR